ncbi:hypothetical protein PUR_13570 [Paenibacillus sp. URB8-2]|nr:hypothetical protein PUR_13570 [Paenibacillus sp. URB8-2]
MVEIALSHAGESPFFLRLIEHFLQKLCFKNRPAEGENSLEITYTTCYILIVKTLHRHQPA